MKLYVTHDSEGNIVAVCMPNPEAGRNIDIIADPGHAVIEVTVPGKPADFATERKATARMTRIAKGFRVSVSAKKGRLVKRKRSSR